MPNQLGEARFLTIWNQLQSRSPDEQIINIKIFKRIYVFETLNMYTYARTQSNFRSFTLKDYLV
jgi:hypothetical protein